MRDVLSSKWRRRAIAPAILAGALLVTFRGAWLDPAAPEVVEGSGFDSPAEAMEWILMSHRDERGVIPRDGLQRARMQADAMRQASLARARAEGAIGATAAAGVIRGAWTWLGPSNIGGRVRGLVVQADGVTLLTGGVAGGIWKSTDAGSSWRLIDDFMGNLAVSTLVARPGEPSRLYAGTGEGFFNSDSIRGAGIFVSTDEGESWSQLGSTGNVNFDFVNRLAFSADGSILLAATRNGLFRSVDLGASWAQVHTASNMLDVKFIPGSSSLVVAGSRTRSAFWSADGGQTWSASTGLAGGATARVELAMSASAPGIVLASVDEASGQIWKSTDAGVNFAKISDPAHLSSQGWYDNAIWIDPTNPSLVVAGGVSLRRSVDGGLTFSTVPACHVDQHAIVHDPGYNGTTNRRVYFGSDGGVCRMNDVTVNSVTSLRNGLGITQFYGGGGHGSAGRIMGGTQDNGTLLYNESAGTTAWTTQFGSDGGFSTVDPTDPNILYGETQNFRIHRSLTGGTPSEYIYGGSGSTSCSKPVPYQLTDACTGTANFISPFILDPNNANRLLAGGRSLWRSNDPRTPNTPTTGPSWAAIKAPGVTNISAIAVAPGNSDIIWVGHNNGDLFMTQDGTSTQPTWTKVDGGTLPGRVINSVAVDPADPNVVYVGLGGFSPDSLWRTTNMGASWDDRTGSGGGALPDAPIRSVVVHQQIRDWVYAASDVGVFASEDGGASWSLPHEGPANVAVFQLFWMDSSLVAVTHGRGMYSIPAGSDVPAFARRPQSQAVISGHTVTFNVVTIGIAPITYQWYRGQSGDVSNPIAGATSASYTTGPITATARYWVRAMNGLGTTDSNTATLTLLPWGTLLPGNSNQGASPVGSTGGASNLSTISATRSTVPAPTSPASAQPAGSPSSTQSAVRWLVPASQAAPGGGSAAPGAAPVSPSSAAPGPGPAWSLVSPAGSQPAVAAGVGQPPPAEPRAFERLTTDPPFAQAEPASARDEPTPVLALPPTTRLALLVLSRFDVVQMPRVPMRPSDSASRGSRAITAAPVEIGVAGESGFEPETSAAAPGSGGPPVTLLVLVAILVVGGLALLVRRA